MVLPMLNVSIPSTRNHHNYVMYHIVCASVYFVATFIPGTKLLYGEKSALVGGDNLSARRSSWCIETLASSVH